MAENSTMMTSNFSTEEQSDTTVPFSLEHYTEEMSNHTSFPDLSQQMVDLYIRLINDKIFKETLLPSMIYLIILLCVGLPGNVLVCYIYHTKPENDSTGKGPKSGKRKSSDIFILALAWLDILNCILSVPMEIFLLRYFVRFDHPWICKFSRYASMVFNAASSFVLLGIAIDRFIGIKYSQSKYRFTSTTALKIVIASVILALVISLPGILLYGTQTVPLMTGIYGKTCLIEDHFVHTYYPLLLSMFLLSVHLLFDVIFVILYGIVGKKIIRNRNLSSVRTNSNRRKNKKKSNDPVEISHITLSSSLQDLHVHSTDKNSNSVLTAGQNSQSSLQSFITSHSTTKQKTTKKHLNSGESAIHGKVYKAGKTSFMLLAVTVTFMVTFAPYCAIAILRSANNDDFYNNMSNTEKAVYQLFLRSYLLSSATNPIIYSFLSDRFRQQCRILFNRIFNC